MEFSRIKKFVLISALSMLLGIGLMATLGHYLAPPPTLEMFSQGKIPPGPQWYLEQLPKYAEHSILTFFHIVPAFLFLVLAPFQLSKYLRNRFLNIHRWIGRIFIIIGISVGISGIVIGVTFPFSGFDETVVSTVIGLLFLYSLFMGVYRVRQGNVFAHRQCMFRMVAIGLTPATMRIFFISLLSTTDLIASEIFATTMWLGLIVNLLVTEWWLAHSSKQVLRRRDKKSEEQTQSNLGSVVGLA